MKKLALAIALSASALPALAEFQPGFSTELLYGKADQESDIEDFGKSDNDDSSMGIRAAYHFNENFAIELSYADYGKAEESESQGGSFDWFGFGIVDWTESASVEHETKAIKLGVKGSIPFGNGFSLIGRAGLSKWDYELTLSYSYFERYTDYTDSSFDGTYSEGFSVSDDDSGTDLYYGVGIQYEFNDNIFTSVEYNITKFDASLGDFDLKNDHEVKNLSISLGYKF